MHPGLSTYVFFEHRLHSGHLDALLAAGARTPGTMTIELFAARHHFDYTDPQSIREAASWFRSNPVRAVLHQPIFLADGGRAYRGGDTSQWSRHVAPNLNLIANEKSSRIAAMDEVKRAIECAEQVPFADVVLHLGLKDTAWDEAAIDNSFTAIEHLKAFASPLGIRLLLENLQNEVTTPEHLLYILKTGHFDKVGVCLDLGHLHLSQLPPNPDADPDVPNDSGVAAAIELLGSRIAQVHLHDNHGPFAPEAALNSSTDMKDEHLWPGYSTPGGNTIDWPVVIPILAASLPDNTPGILEPACDRDETLESVTRKASTVFSDHARLVGQLRLI
jgi:sugar phosphate isomerase/epimerase